MVYTMQKCANFLDFPENDKLLSIDNKNAF